jgi:hypothetical protein
MKRAEGASSTERAGSRADACSSVGYEKEDVPLASDVWVGARNLQRAKLADLMAYQAKDRGIRVDVRATAATSSRTRTPPDGRITRPARRSP